MLLPESADKPIKISLYDPLEMNLKKCLQWTSDQSELLMNTILLLNNYLVFKQWCSMALASFSELFALITLTLHRDFENAQSLEAVVIQKIQSKDTSQKKNNFIFVADESKEWKILSVQRSPSISAPRSSHQSIRS